MPIRTIRPFYGSSRRRGRLILGLLLVQVLVMASGVSAVHAVLTWGTGTVIAVEEPAPAAAGWGPSYVDENGRPGRWDPCRPIPYVVQAQWIPDAGRRDLTEALRRLSAASGLRFVDEGLTDEMPWRDRPAYQPERYGSRWAPLLVGWVPPETTDLGLGGGTPGVAVAVAVPTPNGPSLVSGQVVLNASQRLPSGFGPGSTDGEVLLHELAHVLGLGHVLDPTQVMYPETTSSESELGAGDRAGLAALGLPAGCHPAPRPRPMRLQR